MVKLTPKLKRSITSDWHSLVPQFGEYESLTLARRVGPFVQGIALNRDSTNAAYLPTLFVHCLCRDFPVVSLTLGQPLLSSRSRTPDRLQVQFHEKSYREACTRLLATSLLPTEGDWTTEQVLEAHYAYRAIDRANSRFPVLIMEDGVSALAWLGDTKRATALAEEHLKEASRWPEHVLTQQGGVSNWGSTLLLLARSTETVRETVVEQLESLKLQKLPISQLLP